MNKPLALLAVFGAALALSGCNALTRVSEIGSPPKLTRVENPTARPEYQPVSMPMPRPAEAPRYANSLWRPGARAFLKDQRADEVGDIVTVVIEIEDSAKLSNKTTRARNNSEDADLPAIGGIETQLSKILPKAVNPANLIEFGSKTTNSGEGEIDRDEEINLRVAAIVSQTLPNGNLVIVGRQEVRVNYEMRELMVTGVIRPEDIGSDNSVSYDKIAEARISYGGRGHISDFQQPRYGQQLFDVVFPF
jgi:flagellar L-ring protein precursor FlgH